MKITIHTDNVSKIYVSGQNVTGRVIVECNRPLSTKGFRIMFEGKEEISIEKEEEETRCAKKEFFAYQIYLLGNGSSECFLPKGRFEFPFQFPILPPNIPSSFEGGHGSVSYKLKVLLMQSTLSSFAEIKLTFNAVVDLNLRPLAWKEGTLKKEKYPGYFCCKSGPIGFHLKVPKSGFVPGEFIPVTLEVTNLSQSTNVNGMKLKLVQKCVFKAEGIYETSKNCISEIFNSTLVGGKDSYIWEGPLIQVHNVPPTNLGYCSLIEVKYYIYVELKISGFSCNLTGKMPIEIGTIPIHSSLIKF